MFAPDPATVTTIPCLCRDQGFIYITTRHATKHGWWMSNVILTYFSFFRTRSAHDPSLIVLFALQDPEHNQRVLCNVRSKPRKGPTYDTEHTGG